MTYEQAEQVKRWRETEGWRGVASRWVEKYGEEELLGLGGFLSPWGGNQLAGMALCEEASVLLGEPLE